MKVIVVGSAGQLGMKFMESFGANNSFDCTGLTRDDLDICDAEKVNQLFRQHAPRIVINCAAYTAVDAAETNQERAFEVNSKAARIVARAAAQNGSWLLHFSTDYVFNGAGFSPYSESHETDPISVYGASKRQGELAILEEHEGACIVRTSWLYSEKGNNFVDTMIRLGSSKDKISVVDDQVSSPTYAGDLVECCVELIAQGISTQQMPHGILHFSNAGQASWFDFAKKIMEKMDLDCKVKPISTKEFGAVANRPRYSKLDCRFIENKYGIVTRSWQEGLDDCLSKRKNKGNKDVG